MEMCFIFSCYKMNGLTFIFCYEHLFYNCYVSWGYDVMYSLTIFQ